MADFFHQSRALCESLFYFFLTGYYNGLQAHWDRSIEATKKQKGRPRESTPKWQNAMNLAKNAIDKASLARTQWEAGLFEESKKLAESALECLGCRYVTPLYYR